MDQYVKLVRKFFTFFCTNLRSEDPLNPLKCYLHDVVVFQPNDSCDYTV